MANKDLITEEFKYILRILNTNVDGTKKVDVALTAIKGIGRRIAVIACNRAGIDINRRAGELSSDEIERIIPVLVDPAQYRIPEWFLNRKRDPTDGNSKHLTSTQIDSTLRLDLEKMKKMRLNRGLRHFWGFRVRGQHTKTTGRYGLHAHLSKLKK